jgi:3-hydroxyacyl-[acyl-carrier-protein] dehydratase
MSSNLILDPPQNLIDPKDYPLDKIFLDTEGCKKLNPQREEFQQLTSILHLDLPGNLIVGHRRLEPGEFWERGHLPGRPLFPGVLMIECLAQVGSIQAHYEMELGEDRFLGFGAADNVRFMDPVEPGTDLWIAGHITKSFRRRAYFRWDGRIMRECGKPVCTATITGLAF